MLRFCGILTLALNTAGAFGHQQFGTALVDAVGPALLIGWSEVGPWLLRQVYIVCSPVPEQPRAQPQTFTPRCFLAPCSPGRETSTPRTALQAASPSRVTPSAVSCGSAATGPAP
jgi:hypothetical protein